jgi:hypothetical protein
VQLLLALQLGLGDKALEKKAVQDILTALTVVEQHLKALTFFVGERITVADISYFTVIKAILELGVVDVITMFPSVFRCYMTVGSHELVTAVVGKTAAIISISESKAAQIVHSAVDAGCFPGKWQRNRIRVKELLLKDASMIGKVMILCYVPFKYRFI